ncbi:MAG: TetR/AcrR family transcriptional regulator; helix-turn-helix transcriptional regulator [Coriobacteriales bacterium]|jgi:AcrR family transcriptional regulator|nr:TetR/AcrR family transcriptional regulator; helix-turn-helix transcriptional regulator [Coriobacteriales bacterium]
MDTHLVFFSRDVEMKLRIIRAVDAPIEGLSVQDIADRCGISRQTFYRHFSSKDEMLTWHNLYVRSITIGKVGHTFTWLDAYASHLNLMAQDLPFYRNIVNRTDLHEVAVRFTEQVFLDLLEDRRGLEVTEALRFAAHAQAVLDVRFLVEWIRSDMAMPPDALARHIVECIPRLLYEALELR